VALIDNEDAARRLARVIISDIELYNRDKVDSGADLKTLVDEGFTLFRSRVAPSLHPLYPVVVSGSRLARGLAPGAAEAAAAALPSAASGAAQVARTPASPSPAPAQMARQPDISSRPTPAQPLAVAAVLERELAHTVARKGGTPPPLPSRTPPPLTTPRPAALSATPGPGPLGGERSALPPRALEASVDRATPTATLPAADAPSAEGRSLAVAEDVVKDTTPTDAVTPLESPSYAALAEQQRAAAPDEAGLAPRPATTTDTRALEGLPGGAEEVSATTDPIDTAGPQDSAGAVVPPFSEKAREGAHAADVGAMVTAAEVASEDATAEDAAAQVAVDARSDASHGEDDARPPPASEMIASSARAETEPSSPEPATFSWAPSLAADAPQDALDASDGPEERTAKAEAAASPSAAAGSPTPVSSPAAALAPAATGVRTPTPSVNAPLTASPPLSPNAAAPEDTPVPTAKDPLDEPPSPLPAARTPSVVRTPTPAPIPAPMVAVPLAVPPARAPDEPAPNLRPKRSPVTYVVLAALAAAGAAAYYFWQHRFY
jgi:hypothetical protein